MKQKFLVFLFICLTSQLLAQSPVNVQLFKKFITICNSYKQVPLQLEIEYKRVCDIPWYSDDTSVVKGVFFINNNGAYVHFGKGEQIVTDSMALMVMENVNQMVLSHYKIDIAKQINNFVTMPTDSSLAKLDGGYSIKEKKLGNSTAVIEITNKKTVSNTGLPYEKNVLTYNTITNTPITIEVTKRNLVKKNKNENRKHSAKIISDPQNGDYLLKEDVNTFTFKSIRHNPNQSLPVILTDRIRKDAANNYTPVNAYKNYTLIIN